MSNEFTNSLKLDTLPKIPGNNFNSIINIKDLNLSNLTRNIKMSISDDHLYINISNMNFSKPLIFQIPIEPETFTNLYNHPQVEDLLNRYKLYSTEYKDQIINYSIAERKFIQEQFPNLIFNLKIRQKSEYSYKKKLNDKARIEPEYNLYLHDIIAERIIVSQLDKNIPVPTDKEDFKKYEEELRKTCIEISESLKYFRQTSGFTQIQEKNYILHPKDNGYESIHIIMQNNDNPDCQFETQIRTLFMEKASKTSGEIAHSKYKPRLLNDNSISKLPIYTEITPFTDANDKPISLDIPFDNTFYHFYGVTLKNYREQINTILPLIRELKNKLYQRTPPIMEYNDFLEY